MIQNEKSIIEKVRLNDFNFFVKRDDLLHPFINGNKARKLDFFIQNAKNFPKKTRFVSCGSSQSNVLVALSYFCFHFNFTFVFICEKISSFLKNNPCGNYKFALENNAQIIENQNLTRKDFIKGFIKDEDIFLNEGIADFRAEFGFKNLAKEILNQSKDFKLEFDIFLPSGTGTSALFLAKNLNLNVYTCACVGNENYLREQILLLEPNFTFSNLFILPKSENFIFAKPNSKLLNIYYKSLEECEIEFDLLYDTVGLLCVLEHKKLFKKPLLYIHQGGILGNKSMLNRYERFL